MFETRNKKTIDGILFKKMFINGTINLKNKHQEINNLNVFPIPDGDTGTNMQMTMMEGVEKIKKIKNSSIIIVTKILSDALLFGSKGNSGVILSQFFSGFHDQIYKLQKKNINISEFIDSLANGYKKAYNSVLKPVEGTILTVIRESIEKTLKIKKKLKTIKGTLQKLFQYAQISLEKTPKLLPILEKSNVVDSGGAGFVSFLEGMLLYVDNILLTHNNKIKKEEESNQLNYLNYSNFQNKNHNITLDNNTIKYCYCTEFIFKLNNDNNLDITKKKKELEKDNIGDSLILIKDNDILKIHIHTNNPGVILDNLIKYGNLLKSKIDNMKEQKDFFYNTQTKQNSFIITISSEPKIKKIFQDLKVDFIIEPKKYSIEKIQQIINQNKLNNIIIFPHNDQTIKESLKIYKIFPNLNIRVFKTNNIGQIYSSLLIYNKNLSFDLNLKNIEKNIEKKQIYEIISPNFFLMKQSNSSTKEKFDFIAMVKNKKIYEKDLLILSQKLLKKIINSKNNFLTIFYNKNTFIQNILKKIEVFLENEYENLEIEKIEYNNENFIYIFVVE